MLNVAVANGGSTVYTLLGLPALIYGWREWKNTSPQQRWWMLSLLALFVLVVLSLFYTAELENGAKKIERYFRLASMGLIYLLLRRLQVEAGRVFLLGVGVAAITLGGQALYEIHVLNLGWSTGAYHKIVFGDMAVLSIAVLLAAMLTVAGRGWHYLLLSLCIGLALYASLMSFTRASWLLLPVLGVVVLFLFRRSVNKRLWVILGVLLIGAVVALGVMQPQRLKHGIAQGVNDLQLFMQNPGASSSWGDRLNMWRNSLIIWGQNPFLGTGLGDFNHDSRQLVEQGISYSRHIVQYGHAHSIYFDALATLGAVGLLLLIIALVVLPWRLFSRYWYRVKEPWLRFYALAGLLTVFCFAFFGLTEGWTSRNPFVNPYIVYIAVFASALYLREKSEADGRVVAAGEQGGV